MVMNLMRGKNQKPYHVKDFMPADRPQIDQEEQMWNNLLAMAVPGDNDGGSINGNGQLHRGDGEV